MTAISAGETFSLARTASGKVLAWGSNFEGELGNGSTADSDIPVRVRLPGTSKVTSLAAGAFFAVAGTSGGRVYSWGANNLGQLGTGSSAESSDMPVRVAISQSHSGPVRSLFAGCGHVLALFSPRLLLAWGANKYGELGIGSITPFSNVPVKVHLPAGRKIKAVSASCTDSLALTAAGTCWPGVTTAWTSSATTAAPTRPWPRSTSTSRSAGRPRPWARARTPEASSPWCTRSRPRDYHTRPRAGLGLLVAQPGAAAGHVLLELGAYRVVQGRRLVLLPIFGSDNSLIPR